MIKNNKNKHADYKSRQHLFDILDKTPIAALLTFSAEELFNIQEQASLELEKADYRKKWIDGVIELKYKSTIESSYKKAVEYFNNEPFQEMDKYNSGLLSEYINDNDSIIKVEFYRDSLNENNRTASITGETKNKDPLKIKKKFSLIKANQIKTNQFNNKSQE